ncbi:MAG: efflux RND transporter permease subunit, partial [Deltaproteobacteria bacterium]|nr:efflux RND transporter permease subunit [Deltaproteobacteria bacterium]
MQPSKKGLAGKLAAYFIESKLTPLLIAASLVLGYMALQITPREEEPQILVPMVDVMINTHGVSPQEVERFVTNPIEKLMWGISGVDYIYSTTQTDMVMITLRFEVGTELEPAVVRVHHKLREYAPEVLLPTHLPLVRSYTIDDVPFLGLTFHSDQKSSYELRQISNTFAQKISEIPNISLVRTIGGEPRVVRIVPDTTKLKSYKISLLEFLPAITEGNVLNRVGKTTGLSEEYLVEVGGFLQDTKVIEDLVVAIKAGRAIRLKDVAAVIDGGAQRADYVLHGTKTNHAQSAVTLSLTKRKGTNATALAEMVLHKMEKLAPAHLPTDTNYTVIRNYGETAKEKSNELIKHLLIASISVMFLVALALGMRSSLVVGVAVPVTLALTLFIYYFLGYTLNRVTLFALIFSIGILVDDAIVVVENIHRHLHLQRKSGKHVSLSDIIVRAVDEVGNPTILATFAVIAAILPMAFVRGMMGPYMSPIPVGASYAMIFSMGIAFVISPWVGKLIYKKEGHENHTNHEDTDKHSFLDQVYFRIMHGLLASWKEKVVFFIFVLLMFGGIGALMVTKTVRVKMLPFDNKSEFQVMIDMQEGTPLEKTKQVAQEMANYLTTMDEVHDYQIYVGTSAPINFNGLVRHYFMRKAPHLADIQVNLLPKHERKRQSHDIAKSVRPALKAIADQYGADLKVTEVPPGPPVLSTMVAEIYGPDYEKQIALAKEVKQAFKQTEGVVDVDWMATHPQKIYALTINRKVASLKRVSIDSIVRTLEIAYGNIPLGVYHTDDNLEQVPVKVELPLAKRQDIEALLQLTVISQDQSFVPLKELVTIETSAQGNAIFHKNLQPVVYVLGDLAGDEESPVYALMDLNKKVKNISAPDGGQLSIMSSHQPETTEHYSLKW